MSRYLSINILIKLLGIALAIGLGGVVILMNQGDSPVIKVDIPYPTETKAQSKLWFAKNHWWAWLPTSEGSAIWKRNKDGWIQTKSLDIWLKQFPGYADVWAERNEVWAVAIDKEQLAIAHLNYDESIQQYKPAGDPVIWSYPMIVGRKYPIENKTIWAMSPPDRSIESATIARDNNGRLWIQYDYDGDIWVRYSTDSSGKSWSEGLRLNEADDKIAPDDIGLIVRLDDGVGVVWSNQRKKTLMFRNYIDSKPANQWEAKEKIVEGQSEINDHLNAALALDGTLFVVTKTSKYFSGKPVLSLKIRNADGSWEDKYYAMLVHGRMPTRPIVLISNTSQQLFLINTSIDKSFLRLNRIEIRSADVIKRKIPVNGKALISETFDMRNATSTKGLIPIEQPWFILASDRFGNVYEGIIKK